MPLRLTSCLEFIAAMSRPGRARISFPARPRHTPTVKRNEVPPVQRADQSGLADVSACRLLRPRLPPKMPASHFGQPHTGGLCVMPPYKCGTERQHCDRVISTGECRVCELMEPVAADPVNVRPRARHRALGGHRADGRRQGPPRAGPGDPRRRLPPPRGPGGA